MKEVRRQDWVPGSSVLTLYFADRSWDWERGWGLGSHGPGRPGAVAPSPSWGPVAEDDPSTRRQRLALGLGPHRVKQPGPHALRENTANAPAWHSTAHPWPGSRVQGSGRAPARGAPGRYHGGKS